MKKIETAILKQKLNAFLQKFFEADVAQACADVILYAELRAKGDQGLPKLLGDAALQNVKAKQEIEIQEKSKLSVHIQGHGNPSFYVAQMATQQAIARAQQHGFGIVGANGIFSSTGVLGYYAELMANQGLIGFCCARSPGSVVPFDLTVPLFGTNPLAWGIPTTKEPIVFDMATAAITWYKLVVAKMRGEKIPAGVAIDKFGELTQDPAAAMGGGILPFDKGYKGSGLGMMVELLSGPLVGAAYCDYETFDKDWGFLVMAIDPAILVDAQTFKEQCTDMVNIIHSHGAKIPGENGRAYEEKIRTQGYLEVDDEIAELLQL
ncbi:MAG: Ldh family oxidoreductase [Alphaproteobacteria bacterium]